MAEIPKIVVALLTPFDTDGNVDHAALERHVGYLVDARVDGIMPCGTTGEGPLLSDDEVHSVIETTIEATGDGSTVFAHVGRPGTHGTARMAERALIAGAGAVVAVVPYYYELDQDAIFGHYMSLMDATAGRPTYAYNIPVHTRNDLSAETARKLADQGLTGLKDSTKSFDRHKEYLAIKKDRRRAGDDFEVFMGSDATALEALRAGASGSVSALANARPELFVRVRNAFVEGDRVTAESVQKQITATRAELMAGPKFLRLRQATARMLERHGVSYPVVGRGPLG